MPPTCGGSIGRATHLANGLAEFGRAEAAATLFGTAAAVSPIVSSTIYGWDAVAGKVETALGAARYEKCPRNGRSSDKDAVIALRRSDLDALETVWRRSLFTPVSPPVAAPDVMIVGEHRVDALGDRRSVAVAAILANQLVVSFIPAVPGWFATRDMLERGYI